MTFAIGVPVLLLSLFGWIGQVITTLAPKQAARWGLTEAKADVDPTFLADIRAECVWDSLSLWPLPLAAILLMLDQSAWIVFGLIGGSMFVYFAGRGIAQRLFMQRRSIPVGNPSTVKVAYVFLALWGLSGLAFIVLASKQLITGV